MDTPQQLDFSRTLRSSGSVSTQKRSRRVNRSYIPRDAPRPAPGSGSGDPSSRSAMRPADLTRAIEKAGNSVAPSQKAQLQYLASKITQVVTKLKEEEQLRLQAEAAAEEAKRETQQWQQRATELRDKYTRSKDGPVHDALDGALQREAVALSEKASMERKLSQKEAAVHQLTRMNDMLMDKLDKLQRDIVSAKEGEETAARTCQADLIETRAKLKATEDELQALRMEQQRALSSVTSRQEEMRTTSGRLRQRLEDAEKRASDADTARRRAEDMHKAQQSELRQTIRRLASVEKRLETVTKDLEKAVDENEGFHERLDTLRTRAEKCESENDRLVRKVAEKNKALAVIPALREDLAKAEAASASVQHHIEAKEAAQSALDRMSSQVASLTSTIKELSRKADAAEATAREAQDRAVQATTELAGLKARAESAGAQLDTEKLEVQRLRGEVERVTSQLVDARQARGEAEASLAVAFKERDDLIARLEQTSKDSSEFVSFQRHSQHEHDRIVSELQLELESIKDEKAEMETSVRLMQLRQSELVHELEEVRRARDANYAAAKEWEAKYVAMEEEATRVSVEALRRVGSSSGARWHPGIADRGLSSPSSHSVMFSPSRQHQLAISDPSPRISPSSSPTHESHAAGRRGRSSPSALSSSEHRVAHPAARISPSRSPSGSPTGVRRGGSGGGELAAAAHRGSPARSPSPIRGRGVPSSPGRPLSSEPSGGVHTPAEATPSEGSRISPLKSAPIASGSGSGSGSGAGSGSALGPVPPPVPPRSTGVATDRARNAAFTSTTPAGPPTGSDLDLAERWERTQALLGSSALGLPGMPPPGMVIGIRPNTARTGAQSPLEHASGLSGNGTAQPGHRGMVRKGGDSTDEGEVDYDDDEFHDSYEESSGEGE